MPDPTDEPDRKIRRCLITGNPIGTDTRTPEHDCGCDVCSQSREILRLRAEVERLDEDLSVARQSLYEVAEQRNNLLRENRSE